MGQYNHADEYVDPQTERTVLASLSQDPELYWEHDPSEELFSEHGTEFETRQEAIEAEVEPPAVPDEWTPADDPKGAFDRLRDLWMRRELATIGDAVDARVRSNEPAGQILQDLVEEAAEVRGELKEGEAGALRPNEDVLSDVLSEAEEAREHYQATGDPIRGVKTGIGRLDEITGGLQPGLTILSGGPGVGKTTLALQIGADAASEGVPTLYVTFENSPSQLVLKGMGRVGGINPKDVRRGTVPMNETREAAEAWRKKARRLSFIEGRSDLSRGQIRGKARRWMNRFEADRCLVVVDYLQLYAKASEDLSDSDGLRERVERMGQRLRELAMELRSPVLAIASQNRSAKYSDGGRASLDTLKESGDLEYGADVVAILTEPDDRQATDPASPVDLTVAKNRNGETGRVELIFRPDRGTMRPESYHDEAPQASDGKASPGGDSAPF
ncbi:DnaB-like helicase C-terminal domain-containing protein [Salinibacter altiplanensis]|uniref:DnaB-like helicase C-terminal domain-containing protein n=1 Tax=Salinibacter altiplanensis TaxID=1803181 RepID=UPI000C9F7B29|nr:DnaB-like helicase C-terminal domain-containing protein [Salinibacter altiplanensis]